VEMSLEIYLLSKMVATASPHRDALLHGNALLMDDVRLASPSPESSLSRDCLLVIGICTCIVTSLTLRACFTTTLVAKGARVARHRRKA
jgi:hypothetical protein